MYKGQGKAKVCQEVKLSAEHFVIVLTVNNEAQEIFR